MKSFGIWHIPAMVVAFGAVLTMSPACKSQSEVAPDHFDGNESWVAPQTAQQPAAQKAGANKSKQAVPAQHAAGASTQHAPTAQHAANSQAGSTATVQVAARRNASGVSSAQPASVTVAEKGWNPPTTNSKQQ
jgi:hypothetical protein